jgi:hypothetical protein
LLQARLIELNLPINVAVGACLLVDRALGGARGRLSTVPRAVFKGLGSQPYYRYGVAR